MNKKIIFLLYNPLDERNYKRFGFEILEKDGWDVGCWIFFGKHYKKFENIEMFYKKKENFYFFKSFRDCLKRIKNLPSSFYFVDFWEKDMINNFLRILMILKGGKMICIDTASYPYVYNLTYKSLILEGVSFKKLIIFFKNSLRIVKNKIINNFFFPKPSYHFLPGSKEVKIGNSFFRNTLQIRTHNFNYDNFLNLKNLPNDKKLNNIIVYIDQDYEGNYEYILTREKTPATKNFHWNSLKIFFSEISKLLDKKIVIAAHPRRKNGEKIDTENEIVFNQTANLIKHADLVIGHDSVALEYAVMFNKPIMFISTDEIEKNKQFLWIKKFAEEYGKEVININKPLNLNKDSILSYNKKIYETYFNKYIKFPGSSEKSFWQNFINFLENKNNE
jgi:hypothetical protein